MTFEEAWDGLEFGQWARVSNGQPEPPNPQGLRWKVWRSHNFEGQLVAKVAGPPRGLTLEMEPAGHAHVGFTVPEGPDLFEPI